MNWSKKFSFVLIPVFIVIAAIAWSQNTVQEAMISPVNKDVSSHDVAVTVKNIFLHPNERSLYGPGEKNYGMPVREEYGKGPVVVLDIKKKPDMVDKLGSGDVNGWIHVQLYSDGKPLRQSSGSSKGIYGFSFWVDGPDTIQEVELKELGDVKCLVRLSTVVKVCDIPAGNVGRDSKPFFEDADVRVWDVRWEEKAGYQNEPETRAHIGIETKTAFTMLIAVFKAKDGGQDIKPASTTFLPVSDSSEKGTMSFSRYIALSRLGGAELWKIVPVIEKTFPVKFVPQKDIFRN